MQLPGPIISLSQSDLATPHPIPYSFVASYPDPLASTVKMLSLFRRRHKLGVGKSLERKGISLLNTVLGVDLSPPPKNFVEVGLGTRRRGYLITVLLLYMMQLLSPVSTPVTVARDQ